MSSTWIWLGVAIIAAGLEIFTVDLTFLLIAAGALTATGLAAVGAPLWVQVVAGGAVSLAGILFVRPVALRHLRRMPAGIRTGVDALPGATGRALTEVTTDTGRMNLRGEVWSARLDPDVTRVPVPTGTPLIVTRIDGATALVHPIDE
jgi:membrane protein implicated in regulation of membrane protease activity